MDQSVPRSIKDETNCRGNRTRWIEWIRLGDQNGDGFLGVGGGDLNRRLRWLNDGAGPFAFSPS